MASKFYNAIVLTIKKAVGDLADWTDDGAGRLAVNSSGALIFTDPNGDDFDLTNGGGAGTVTEIIAGTGLTGGTITDSGTIAIDSTVATLTGSQALTNKTLTAPIINGATSASGNFDLSGSSGTFKTTAGAATYGGSSNTFTADLTVNGSTGVKVANTSAAGIYNQANTKGLGVDYSTLAGIVYGGSFGPYTTDVWNCGDATHRWAGTFSGFYDTKEGAQLTAAATITPTTGQHHITGATTIDTIATTNFTGNADLFLIADGGTITFSAAGNILSAGTIAQDTGQLFRWSTASSKWVPHQ